MKSQHQVVLSIGTNQGDRLQNIERCLQLIHEEVATVIKVSKVYETPSWGFDSDAFYNAAILIHTFDSAAVILEKALRIEKQMGRVRSEGLGYQSRSIDIDVITFDTEIISSDQLEIPHPLMHASMDEESPIDLNL
jgi:2-amino-4-hydroxy-6-hydroxymethyldihydropteridine diphosphokinase